MLKNQDPKIIKRLDLEEYIKKFEELLARPKPYFMEGDRQMHYRFIQALDRVELKEPPKVRSIDDFWMRLSKQGVLRLDEIFEIVKIVRYFIYLKSLQMENELGEWLHKIEIPPAIVEIERMFDEKGDIKESVDERLASLKSALERNKEAIKQTLLRLLGSPKLISYLVDRQIHYINDEEALLVRGGFNQIIKGAVIGRTSAGFFYVLPEAISRLKEKESAILSRIEELYEEISRQVSGVMASWLKFFRFIDRAFDRFDHYHARVMMARLDNLSFVLPENADVIVLKEFAHPALTHPKPVSIDFTKKILMITGVNAGGKTMLLKSILSSAWLAKHLLPMRCRAEETRIGSFRRIEAIIEDPQNVRNDISTFAGRMRQFSRLFGQNGVLVGVDEIELGTDSDEAATLFKVIMGELLKKNIKIVITTHHKRLAAMMAADKNVELAAAVYDEKNRVPTFTFLQGIIGKSYAFETAERYGIPKNIVQAARVEYGEDKERLNELIERSSILENELRKKKEEMEREISALKIEKERYKEMRDSVEQKLIARKLELEAIYEEATKEARKALKLKDEREIHRTLGRAHKKVQKAKIETFRRVETFEVGDIVKYGKNRGTIIALKAKEATIEVDGIKFRVPLAQLKHSKSPPKSAKKGNSHITLERDRAKASVKLDLHGLRVEEALEKLDRFLSDALLAGFDEVLVYHGIGTGRLANAVRTFLKEHPSVKSFHDAPQHMGGFGATIIDL